MAKIDWDDVDKARLIMANKESADTTEMVYRLSRREHNSLYPTRRKSKRRKDYTKS